MIHTNSLINESSPYLLQHAHNPVNWFPWGNKALDRAKKENKPIIVSIGYAACHWCHVMEHESFEDEEVAQIMNDSFISIKVDREERPDIDQVYMNALQLITGAGGWPLNCILLPDTRPVYGATYFPKAQWVGVLKQVSNYIKNNPEKAKQQAETITQAIQSSETIFSGNETIAFTIKDLDNIFNSWKINIDYVNGGNKGAPKFPMPVDWEFLLSYHDLTGNEDALKAVTTTLNKMGDGGIYDHISGGFARYSTDDYWKVPHFEKMLYDNAQLVSLYSLAYKHTKTEQYKSIVSETLNFIQRELTSKEGGFYSSLDADTENEEGKFYVWTKNELEELLGGKSSLVIDYFNISEQGNWEKGQNILFKSANDKETAEKYKITETNLSEQISEAKQTLLKARAKRTAPGLDDKILTSWNSLMLKAYVDAYRVFDNQKYLDTALKNADFINTKLKADDNRLNRNYKNNKASINGFLDDYAFTIEAFISLYQATSDKQWLLDAKELLDYTVTHFFDKNTGMFFYTSDIDPELIARKTEVTDNVIPSSNSQMAKNLFMLGHYLNMDKYSKKSEQMLNNIKQNALKHGHYYANWNILATWFAKGPSEIDIIK